MKRQRNKLSFIIVIAAMLMLAIAVPASAKTSTAWRKAYKNYLAKGKVSYPVTTVKTGSKGKVISRKTRTQKVKIEKFALANIDGKGAPELILTAKWEYSPNSKIVYIARLNGNKVQLAYTSENKNKYYGIASLSWVESDDPVIAFNLNDKNGGIWFDSKNSVVIAGIEPSYEGYYFTRYSNGKLTGIGYKTFYEEDEEDGGSGAEYSLNKKGSVPSYMKKFAPKASKALKLYSNTKANRNKIANGKIKAAK